MTRSIAALALSFCAGMCVAYAYLTGVGRNPDQRITTVSERPDPSAELIERLASLERSIGGQQALLQQWMSVSQPYLSNGSADSGERGLETPQAFVSGYSAVEHRDVPRPVIFASPTPEQNAAFEDLKARLEDPLYLSALNLQAFSASLELQSLPEGLQLVLIQRAIDKYNSGYISGDVFLGFPQVTD